MKPLITNNLLVTLIQTIMLIYADLLTKFFNNVWSVYWVVVKHYQHKEF